jgi:glyoxylase-like metal-dependent hydrolase (beta-lactamase superfamily II)
MRLAAAPPERVAPGVWLIRGGLARTMNVFLLEEAGGGVTAFDAGEKGMAAPIASVAARLGGLRRVVLGHGDTDHRGSAPALSVIAPVLCHPDAVQEAEGSGGRSYWRMDQLTPFVRAFHGFMHAYVWDGGPVRIAGTVAPGDDVAGFRVVELAGHAPGLIALWRESDRLALVSDVIYMTSMLGRPTDPHVPLDAYNLDTERARESIRRLAALEPATVWPGHRGPLAGPDVVAALERAAVSAS